MTDVFGNDYSAAYDAFYRDKDYDAECDLVERIFKSYRDETTHSVLDLGCGTGNHALPLAQRGYEVVAVDRSEAMLQHAKEKLSKAPDCTSLSLIQGDIRELRLDRRFDAALMMFAVLGYQVENQGVIAALQTARRHLRVGGLFLFDVWYGPAVLAQRPTPRVRTIDVPGGQILRISSGELDSSRSSCDVSIRVLRLDGSQLIADTRESHLMRYFFPPELDLLLTNADFDLLRIGAFPDFDKEPDEQSWSVLAVARAVEGPRSTSGG